MRPAPELRRLRPTGAKVAVAAAVACVLVAVAAASAAASPPSAVQQYIETLPTGSGGQPLGPGTTPPATPSSGSAQSSSLQVSPENASQNTIVGAAFETGSTADTVLVALGLAVVVVTGAATAGWRLRRRARTG